MPKIFCEGKKFTVEVAKRNNGSMPAYDFINKLSKADKAKVTAIIKRLADTGIIRNKEKFKSIGNNLYEIKSFQIRIFCCFAKGRLIILLSGIFKKTWENGYERGKKNNSQNKRGYNFKRFERFDEKRNSQKERKNEGG